MEVKVLGDWLFYSSTKEFNKGPYYGEWLVFFSQDSYDYVKEKCHEAVDVGLVKWAKHSTPASLMRNHNGLFALKLEDTDVTFVGDKPVSTKHQQVLQWLIKNGFIRKTKSGKYTNIRFKLDSEGKGVHASSDWKGFTLSDFLDVTTGQAI